MNRRPNWWFPLVMVLLVGIPIVEVWLLIQVGDRIGVAAIIAILVVEVMVGAWLMKREGLRAWTALHGALQTQKMPSGELADAAFVLIGGVLLMLPGFATDLIGFFFLLPFTRPLARHLLGFFVARQLSRSGVPVMGARLPGGDVIQGETGPYGSAPSAAWSDAPPRDPQVLEGTVVFDEVDVDRGEDEVVDFRP